MLQLVRRCAEAARRVLLWSLACKWRRDAPRNTIDACRVAAWRSDRRAHAGAGEFREMGLRPACEVRAAHAGADGYLCHSAVDASLCGDAPGNNARIVFLCFR